jgi:hypothetical protein
MNLHAQALGRRGKGKAKTMSEAAMVQRRLAALLSAKKRTEKKIKKDLALTETLS